MARRREEEPAPGSPAWMATFSDLMNLLLCFFVLLFSMSTIDAQKFELMVPSFSQSFSIFTAGGDSVGEGVLLGNGVSQLNKLDNYVMQEKALDKLFFYTYPNRYRLNSTVAVNCSCEAVKNMKFKVQAGI